MSTTPDRIEAEVEANRANVETTLGALKDRLSVESIVNDASRFVGISDTRGTLVAAAREIKADPVAFGMIGLGLALLATGVTRRNPDAVRYGPPTAFRPSATGYDNVGARSQGNAAQARDTGPGYAASANEAYSNVADSANRHIHDAQPAIHEGYDYARHRAADLQRRAGHQMEAQPLLFGALALAAGAVIAAALPRSRTEDEWIGPSRNHLLDEAKHAAVNLGDRATTAAKAGVDAAISAAKNEGLVPQGGETLAAKAEHVAEAAAAGAKARVDEDRRQ